MRPPTRCLAIAAIALFAGCAGPRASPPPVAAVGTLDGAIWAERSLELLRRGERGEAHFPYWGSTKSALGMSATWNPLLLDDEATNAELLAIARRLEAADPVHEMRDGETFRDDTPALIRLLALPRSERVMRQLLQRWGDGRYGDGAELDEPVVPTGGLSTIAGNVGAFPGNDRRTRRSSSRSSRLPRRRRGSAATFARCRTATATSPPARSRPAGATARERWSTR